MLFAPLLLGTRFLSEVDNLDQLKVALGEGADAVLLDNMELG